MSIYASVFSQSSELITKGNQGTRNDTSKTTFAEQLGAFTASNERTPKPLLNVSMTETASGASSTGSLAVLNRLWELLPSKGTINAETPQTFVQSIVGPANRAAIQLGTTPAAVIAIAALETGWGQHVINSREYGSSNNLFGIKATDQDLKDAVKAKTSEYIDGIEHTFTEPFRVYPSPADSVADFADFLHSNPRYSDALEKSYDTDEFIEQIQLAGYATDPNYASKVRSVMQQVEQIMRSDPTMAVR